MSTSSTSEYLLLFRGSQWDKGLTTEQLQATLGQVQNWFERLKQEIQETLAHAAA